MSKESRERSSSKGCRRTTSNGWNFPLAPARLLSSWQHLRCLEVYNAGLLLPAVAQALIVRPFPHLTHLILHTKNMPCSPPVAWARNRVRLRTAGRAAALKAGRKAEAECLAALEEGEGGREGLAFGEGEGARSHSMHNLKRKTAEHVYCEF